MKKAFRVGGKYSPLMLWLLTVIVILSLCSGAKAASTGSLACNSCHGMPPLDSNKRDRVTGGFPGNHQTHGPASSATEVHCARCHVSAGFSSSHSDQKISFRSNINNSPLASQYRVAGVSASFRNQTTVPVFGTCSNVNCHFESATPVWGSNKYSSTSDCSACHAVPANSSGHGRHDQYFPGASGCSKCHPDWATGLKFSHATSATNRGIRVTLSEGSYSGAGTNFLPSQSGSRAFGTCSNLYCHSDGKTTPTYRSVSWGGSGLPADCSGCHGNAASGTLSGKHDKHINNASVLGSNYRCAACHGKTMSSGSDTAISNRSKHVNRFIDYSGAGAGRNGNDCSNIYCHSDGKGNFVNPGSWTAGAPIDNCKGCHGAGTVAQGAAFDSVAGEPNYVSGTGGAHKANSHLKHVGSAGASTCDACHALTTTTGTSILSGSLRHTDGIIDVSLNPAKAGASAQWVAAGKSCNNIICHSGGSAQWGQPGNCDICHPAASLKGAHSKHLSGAVPAFYSYTANRSYGDDPSGRYEFGCSNCHPLVSSSHGNGQVALDFRPVVTGQNLSALRSKNRNTITIAGVAGTAGGTDPSSVPGSRVICLNLYCHSNGYGANTVYATTPDWYGGSFTGDRCASCHGNSPNSTVAGSPAHASHVVGIHSADIFSGGVGKLAAGGSGNVSHGIAGQATTINCNTCHSATVTSSRNDRNTACSSCHSSLLSLAQIGNRASHVNGRVDVSFQDMAVVSKAQIRSANFSNFSAGSGYWSRNAGNYKNGALAFDTAKQKLSAGVWSAGSCLNIACHMNNSVTWTDSTVDCNNCHTAL